MRPSRDPSYRGPDFGQGVVPRYYGGSPTRRSSVRHEAPTWALQTGNAICAHGPRRRTTGLTKVQLILGIVFSVLLSDIQLGETAGDLFAQTLHLGYFRTTIVLFALFVVTLVVQLRSRRYNPFFYWTVILSTSMAGTTMSDFMNRDASEKYLPAGMSALGWGPQGLGLGYPAGAAILISLLIVIFIVWKVTGLTFAIRDIDTFRGEALFWAAILVSNTLGTSMGDFLSDSSGLGYAGGALLVTGLLALKYVRSVPNVVLFWLAFVLTRPLGATAGDFLTKPVAKGGLALGTLGSSLVLLGVCVLFGLMAYAHVQERSKATTGRVGHPILATRV